MAQVIGRGLVIGIRDLCLSSAGSLSSRFRFRSNSGKMKIETTKSREK